jgi:hypothetical protein
LLIDHLAELWREFHSEGCHLPVNIGFYGREPLLNVSFFKEMVSYEISNRIIFEFGLSFHAGGHYLCHQPPDDLRRSRTGRTAGIGSYSGNKTGLICGKYANIFIII